MHRKGLRIPTCEYCDREFASNYLLQSHKQIHTRVYKYQCMECPEEKFRCRKDLNDHLGEMHLNKTGFIYYKI